MQNLIFLFFLLLGHLSVLGQSSPLSTRAMDQRLIAVHTDYPNGSSDSLEYHYSGPRGSIFEGDLFAAFKYEQFALDNFVKYTRDSGLVAYTPQHKIHKSYNSSNLKISEIDSIVDMNVWVKNNRSTLSYNGNNQLVHDVREGYNVINLVWDTLVMTNTFYSGNRISRIGMGLVQNQWDSLSKHDQELQGSDIIENIYSSKLNGIWSNESRDSFAYSGGHLVSHYRFVWYNNRWEPVERIIYSYNLTQRLDSIIVENDPSLTSQWQRTGSYHPIWNGNKIIESFTLRTQMNITTETKRVLTYNAHGYPDTDQYLKWDGTQYQETALKKYYYEAYNNSVGLDRVKSSLALRTYPNPVRDKLFVALDDFHLVSLQIFDLTGRCLYNSKVLREYIEVSEFVSGNYILKALDKNGNSFTVQFSKY